MKKKYMGSLYYPHEYVEVNALIKGKKSTGHVGLFNTWDHGACVHVAVGFQDHDCLIDFYFDKPPVIHNYEEDVETDYGNGTPLIGLVLVGMHKGEKIYLSFLEQEAFQLDASLITVSLSDAEVTTNFPDVRFYAQKGFVKGLEAAIRMRPKMEHEQE